MFFSKYYLLSLFLFFAILGCSQEKQDLSIPMKGGDYDTEVIKIVDSIEDPTKRTRTRCYPESVFDPFKTYHQDENCKISNVDKKDQSVSFDFDCTKGAGANAKGKMQYSVSGEKIFWQTNISEISGNEIDVITKGEGTYIGKCK